MQGVPLNVELSEDEVREMTSSERDIRKLSIENADKMMTMDQVSISCQEKFRKLPRSKQVELCQEISIRHGTGMQVLYVAFGIERASMDYMSARPIEFLTHDDERLAIFLELETVGQWDLC